MPNVPAAPDSPLYGVRVIDFSRVLAGPFCTRILCDLGAEVIKIEPPGGDLSRRLGARRGGMSGYYMQQNCGKQNLSIDLGDPRGRALALELARKCDVLVENFRPGVMEQLGLGPEPLCRANERLIYCSISGFGHTGPWKKRRAFAGIAHATTGMLWRQATASGTAPTDSVLALGDTVTGLQAAIAILAALALRQRSGRGQYIDMAMHDALLSIQEAANFHLFAEQGNDTDFLCAWIYRCGKHYVAMPADPRAQWEQLALIIGRRDLITDPRYDTYEKRALRLPELEAYIGAWVAEQENAEAVVTRLASAGLPAARLLRMGEALDCEQTIARNMVPFINDRSGRQIRVLNSPYRFSSATAGLRGQPAFRGEDNRSVLKSLLGLGDDEIEDLERAGVLSSRIPAKKREP